MNGSLPSFSPRRDAVSSNITLQGGRGREREKKIIKEFNSDHAQSDQRTIFEKWDSIVCLIYYPQPSDDMSAIFPNGRGTMRIQYWGRLCSSAEKHIWISFYFFPVVKQRKSCCALFYNSRLMTHKRTSPRVTASANKRVTGGIIGRHGSPLLFKSRLCEASRTS